MVKSIPVMGTAIVNSPHWLARLVMSVDYPVDNFIIFNNNGRGQITEELDTIAKLPHKYIKKISVCHLPSNIGCGGAWNLIIKSYLNAPYWVIVNYDVAFTAGFLKEMVAKSQDDEVGIVHGKDGDHKLGCWDLFLIKELAIKRYGLFDDNFYPAYDEDFDYLMRMVTDEFPMKRVTSVGLPYFHGETTDYALSGSQTWRTDLSLKDKLDNARILNESQYMCQKWGYNWHYCRPYNTPFNNPAFPKSYTTFDLEFVRKKHLGF